MQVAKNTVVSFDYTLTNPQGEELDTSIGGHPFAYLHGVGGIVPGLEQAMDGKAMGDAFAIVVPPELGYGEHNSELVQAVPRKMFNDSKVQPGMDFEANTPAGRRVVKIVSVDAANNAVTVDANHPLAGVTLHFDVKIVEVRPATAEEISHGHVHGAGGHHH